MKHLTESQPPQVCPTHTHTTERERARDREREVSEIESARARARERESERERWKVTESWSVRSCVHASSVTLCVYVCVCVCLCACVCVRAIIAYIWIRLAGKSAGHVDWQQMDATAAERSAGIVLNQVPH
jgi:hypothetical protein